MSVPVSKRSQSTLKVLDAARILSRHTVQKCKNERLFPKRNRWVLTQRIVSECLDAQMCIRHANATPLVPGNAIAYQYRYAQQIEAHAHLDAMYDLLDIAFATLDELRGDESFDYWSGLIQDTDDLLKRWVESDKKRYQGTSC